MLKKLSIDFVSSSRNDSDSISSQGWVSLFNSLQDTNLDLSSLSLHENKIDDEGLQLLVQLVSNMKSLKFLDLHYNDLVTPAGWQALTGYLQSPNCSLKELHLHSNNINNETMVEFTMALVQNKTLKRLTLDKCLRDEQGNYSITERGLKAISTLLCNKSSIMETFSSNHTLQNLGRYFPSNTGDTGDEILSLLDLNKNKDKAEVARQKILQTYFSDNDTTNMQELLGMELEIMPAAISWIGRPVAIHWSGTNVSGLSLMYNLVRKMPDLFDTSAQKKSTKRNIS